MATWIGTSRSNFFRVRDPEAFYDWARDLDLNFMDHVAGGTRRFAVFGTDWEGCWPLHRRAEHGVPQEIDFVEELATHVLPGEIVVLMQAGAEKRRYVTGEAIAFRIGFAGIERLKVDLADIYDLAEQKWGARPRLAAYGP